MIMLENTMILMMRFFWNGFPIPFTGQPALIKSIILSRFALVLFFGLGNFFGHKFKVKLTR